MNETELDDLYNNVEVKNFADFQDWFSDCSSLNGSLFLHLNIRSIRKNWDTLMLQLDKFINKIDVLLLSEIGCTKDEIDTFTIPHFNSISYCRVSKGGGGLVLYYNANKYKLSELLIKADSFEGVSGVLEPIDTPNLKIQIMGIYRPPSQSTGYTIRHFLVELNLLLRNKCSTNNLILMGDMNINIFDKVDPVVTDYESLLASHGLIRIIFDYTREEIRNGVMTRSCIDHLYI